MIEKVLNELCANCPVTKETCEFHCGTRRNMVDAFCKDLEKAISGKQKELDTFQAQYKKLTGVNYKPFV